MRVFEIGALDVFTKLGHDVVILVKLLIGQLKINMLVFIQPALIVAV